MKKIPLTLFLLFVLTTSCKSQKLDTAMENEIKSVIETFARAGAENNASLYKDILHKDFRVIANQYPTPDKISIIPAAGYIALIAKGTIGGTKYDLIFKDIAIAEHSATAIVHFKTLDGGGQLLTLLLIKNSENKWELISDMATQIKK